MLIALRSTFVIHPQARSHYVNGNLLVELGSSWKLDNMGIHETKPRHSDENNIMGSFTPSIRLNHTTWCEPSLGIHQLEWCWKRNHHWEAFDISLNKAREEQFNVSEIRHSYIRSYLEQDFAEKVSRDEMHDPENKMYYMPHKTDYVLRATRQRFGWWSMRRSSHVPGCLSPNDSQQIGPNLIPDLLRRRATTNGRMFPRSAEYGTFRTREPIQGVSEHRPHLFSQKRRTARK